MANILRKSNAVDMTSGSILKHLISFSVPLLLGNLFQQLYNMVDTWVVGNFVGDTAFSAVGTVGPIVNMMIGFFMGLASGAGVVISQYFGAGREKRVERTVHTSILLTLILAVICTVGGILLIPAMLDLINMPENIRADATTYLTIYFAGLTGLMVYNMGAGILRAVGDSKRPFYYLVVTALLNTVLDLVFVLCFGMKVEGVAWATIISQGVSALLVIIALLRYDGAIRLRPSKLRIDWRELWRIFTIGLPAGLQMAITSFSNVFVQSYINHFGGDVMGGYTAYHKVDQILFLPMQSIGLAATTFVGQNLGKGDVKRAKKGVSYALYISLAITAILIVPIFIFAPAITSFFNSKPEIIENGAMFLHWMTPFYILVVFNQVYSCALRGAGNSRVPMVIMLVSFVLFRQIYLYIMANFVCNEIIPIAMGYPAGWLLSSILTVVYYFSTDLVKTRVIKE